MESKQTKDSNHVNPNVVAPINLDVNIVKQIDLNKFPENVEIRPIFEWNEDSPVINNNNDITILKKEGKNDDFCITLNKRGSRNPWNDTFVSLRLYLDTLVETIERDENLFLSFYNEESDLYECKIQQNLNNVSSIENVITFAKMLNAMLESLVKVEILNKIKDWTEKELNNFP